MTAIDQLAKKYEGLTVKKISNGWELIIPAKYELNHEACFAEVTKRYLDYLKQGNFLPGKCPICWLNILYG